MKLIIEVSQEEIRQALGNAIGQTQTVEVAGEQISQVGTWEPGGGAAVEQPIPVEQKAYTLDEITKAAISLMDKGQQQALQQLLQKHNVQALPQLPVAEYGNFALELRGMGAEI